MANRSPRRTNRMRSHPASDGALAPCRTGRVNGTLKDQRKERPVSNGAAPAPPAAAVYCSAARPRLREVERPGTKCRQGGFWPDSESRTAWSCGDTVLGPPTPVRSEGAIDDGDSFRRNASRAEDQARVMPDALPGVLPDARKADSTIATTTTRDPGTARCTRGRIARCRRSGSSPCKGSRATGTQSTSSTTTSWWSWSMMTSRAVPESEIQEQRCSIREHCLRRRR
jgi:hypothetical protein